MSTVIRLARYGTHKRPYYHVVVTDKRNPRNGDFIEKIGFFNPIANEKQVEATIDLEKYNSWVNKGAIASDTVKKVMKQLQKKKA